jgi:hypothetical protein
MAENERTKAMSAISCMLAARLQKDFISLFWSGPLIPRATRLTRTFLAVVNVARASCQLDFRQWISASADESLHTLGAFFDEVEP